MEATRAGYDVYSPEVNYRGVDFVLRTPQGHFMEAQVKSARWPSTKYVFIPKSKFDISDRLLLFVVIFEENEMPTTHMLPSRLWLEPNAMFVSRDYVGLKSKPEYGLNIRNSWRSDLAQFRFEHATVTRLGS